MSLMPCPIAPNLRTAIPILAGAAFVLALAQGCATPERHTTDARQDRVDALPGPGERIDSAAVTPSGDGPVVRPGNATQVLAAVRAAGAEATIVNVWATWCPPCREEFPDLVRFERDYRSRGVRLVLVSTDFEDQVPVVRRFLARQGVDEPSWIKTGDDMEFIDAIHPEWTGALPATFIFDGSGHLRAFWEGAADYRKFELEVGKVLKENLPS